MHTPLRVIIADDHTLFRQGLKSLLLLHSEFEVVAKVERAAEMAPTLAVNPCDILLLDLRMDRWLLKDIGSLARITTVVVLTASESLEDATSALRLGARAIVQKRFAIETLMAALRTVADGLVWLPSALQTELAKRLRTPSSKRLTARESEIMRHVALGLRNAEVAERLCISESTVKTHLNNIFQKLGLRDRVELTHHALRAGLLTVQSRE